MNAKMLQEITGGEGGYQRKHGKRNLLLPGKSGNKEC